MEWTLEGLRQPHRYVLDAAQLHIYMLMKKVGTSWCPGYHGPFYSFSVFFFGGWGFCLASSGVSTASVTCCSGTSKPVWWYPDPTIAYSPLTGLCLPHPTLCVHSGHMVGQMESKL